jgi:acid phosphatase (class A)
MNMDFNMNMVRSGASVGGDLPRIRANTEDYRKYVALGDPVIPANPNLMGFPRYWDAELRAYEYLNDFLTNQFGNWQTTLKNDVAGGGPPANLTPPHKLGAAALTIEINYILDSAPDRQDRFSEIIGQNSGEGAIGYFLGMLMIDPARMPATNLLIRVARRLGEHVVMCLKGHFLCPRPSQLCPAIVPMIDPPATPSFPSGHSLQAWLIARCLEATNPPMRPLHLVRDLANRIGENRIIAGIHYLQDHVIGQAVAEWVYTKLLNPLAAGTPFKLLLAAATNEMANQWAPPPAVLPSPLP